MKDTGLASSNKEGRRKIEEGAVKILDKDGEEIQKIDFHFAELEKGKKVLKLGKKMVKINIL